jgi:hypothetical protein
MKKRNIILFLILITINSFAYGFTSSRSLAFSDSYGLRAIGADALYWNPASLNARQKTFDIPITNLQFHLENNGFNIHTYNEISGHYLDDALKEKILSGFKGHLGFESSMHTTILGTTFGKFGLGIGVNASASGKLSKQYLNLLLYGNQEDQEITFTQKHNDAEGIVYSDLTIGSGDYEISKLIPSYAENELPPITFGASLSLLTGIKGFEVSSFRGHFSAGDDGINLVQDIVVKEGTLGFGYKGMVGFKSQPMDHLEVGLTIDNILGNIKWSGDNKIHYEHVDVDSVYIADLDNDIFDPTDSTANYGTFTTKLPAEMNISFLYQLKMASVSLDWKQGFKESFITSRQPRISLGAEYLPSKIVPIQFGYSLPNKFESYQFSYGLGMRLPHFEFGIAVQSSHALVPCNLSRGFTFALHSRVLY